MLAILLGLAGCAETVKVTRVGPDAGLAPKAGDCPIEFLLKPPERLYDPIADLESHLTDVPPQGSLSVLREPACRLGADAVIVTRNFVINMFGHMMVAGTAIRWAGAAPPPAPEAQPAAPPKPAPESD